MEKKIEEGRIFEEMTLVIEVVGDVAILRKAMPNMPPKVIVSGSRNIVAKELASILR